MKTKSIPIATQSECHLLLKQMTHLTSIGLLLLDILGYVSFSHLIFCNLQNMFKKKTTSNLNITSPICITKQI